MEVRARVLAPADAPGALAVCAGYDERRWRAEALAEHLCRWIPEWALRYGEWDLLNSATMLEMARRAAQRVYTTDEYEGRGEFGELMLHSVIRWEFDTDAAISKIYFKDSANDAVKGFDCVHVSSGEDGGLDLWLGEAKFYVRLRDAISDVVDELRDHLQRDYLREEFALVADKVDPAFPWSEQLKDLLDDEKPLDQIVSRIHIPVLLAYESKTISNHDEVTAEYRSALESEARAARDSLLAKLDLKPLPRAIQLELILLPVESKKRLMGLLHNELLQWQGRA